MCNSCNSCNSCKHCIVFFNYDTFCRLHQRYVFDESCDYFSEYNSDDDDDVYFSSDLII